LLEQKLTKIKVRQKLILIIVEKLVKREFIKILKDLIKITIKLLKEDWMGFN